MNKDFLKKILLLIFLYFLSFLVIFWGFSNDVKEIDGWQHIRPVLFILFVPLLTKYFIHLLIVPWYEVFNKKILKNSKKNYKPVVSFILPAWNEEVGIIETIKSILKSNYKNFELIVVNDGSTDKTHETINLFLRDYNGNITVKYFKKENGGKSSAINLGIKKSSGEIVITTDADCSIDSSAIRNLVKYFIDPKVMAVAGNVRPGNTKKIIGSIQKLEYLYGFYFKRADSILNSVYIVGGAAAAYRKTIFNEIGGFDTEIITEDIEYSTRILDAGYKIRYASDAVFYTEVPSDINSLIKQRLRWKYGRLKTFYKYRNLFFNFRGKQSKFLSFITLPVAFFAEILLLLEILLLPIFYAYSFLSNDFLPLIYLIFFLSIIIFIQILTDVKIKQNKNILIWVPVAWLVFYFIDFIEYISLIKSLEKIFKNTKVSWQKWNRVGVFAEK